jgi:hypothetical protein
VPLSLKSIRSTFKFYGASTKKNSLLLTAGRYTAQLKAQMPKNKSKLQAKKEGNNPSKRQDDHGSETRSGQKRTDQNRGKGNVKPQGSASKDRESKSGKLAHDPFFAASEASHGNNGEKNGNKQQKKPHAVSNAKKDFKGRSKPYSKPQLATKDRPSKPAKQKHDTFFAAPQKAEDDVDDDRKKQKNFSQINKGQHRKASISKPAKQKHDTFFAPPPESTNEDREEQQDKSEAEKPSIAEKESDVDSMAVIETIKIPEPGETILDAKSNIAVRSGVVSVVDKTDRKRKRSKIDVVAELENDAKKMTRTSDSLGAGLEVDGWD